MIKQIFYTGSKYDSTKEILMDELILFVERDLKLLSERHYELSLSFRVQAHLDKTTQNPRLVVEVLMKQSPSHLYLLESEIEDILWSYNKQVLTQNGGRFYTHYVRFEYSLRYTPEKPKTGSGEVFHLKTCNG